MASPFRVFRKNQKALMAIAGVVIIFVFVLGDSLSQYVNSRRNSQSESGQSPNDIAVKWNDGQLTNAELGQLVVQRRVVNAFLRQVEGIGRQAAIEAGGEPQPLRVEIILGAERPQDGVERDVLRMRLFADAARKAGMAISDEHIVNYLQQLGRGYVSVDMIRQILAAMPVGGRQASIDFVIDALREEMLARNYLASYIFAFDTNLPEQRWRDWLYVNDRVVVEAAAIPAESMLVDVKDPTDAELVAFFDEYKDDEPRPQLVMGVELPSPNPGFAVPRKVAVQYLLADFNQFLTTVEDQVTDAEIEKFYEDNKDPHFVRAESLLGEPGDEAADEAETNDDEAKASEAKEAVPTGDAKPAPATNDESSRLRKNPFRLTAFAEDAPAGTDVEPKIDDSTAAPQAAAPSAATAEPAPAAELAAPTEKPKVFQPLDEVRDEIRRELAQFKVNEQLEKLMVNLDGELNESYYEYFGASVNAETEGKVLPPVPALLADLTPLAQKNGLTYQKTEPASMLQLRDTPIGASVRRDQGNTPFYYSVFGRDVEFYQPIATYDLDNNRYLAMKIQDVPGKVPTLDEVRDQVVRAWKLRKAGELALKRAEELAKQAQDKGGSIQEAFADDPSILITKTDPFAYLTIGNVSRDTQQVQSFRLSEPEGIVAAGPTFMERVFNSKDGEVAAAPNQDNSIAYVVKIAEHQNTPAELQQDFLSEADTWYGLPAMSRARSQTTVRVVVADMLEAAGVDWIRDPDQVIQPEEEAEATTEADKS